MKKQRIKRLVSMMLAAVLLVQGPILSTELEAGEHTHVHAEGNNSDSAEEVPECNSENGKHQWNTSGSCSACGKSCSHDWNGYGACSTCGYYCSHDWSNANGTCTICKMNHSCEKYSGGKCMTCGKPCQHKNGWSNSDGTVIGTCPLCGTVCSHPSYEDSGLDPDPTCTEKGIHCFHCTVCGQLKTEEVPALGHDWSNGNGICAREACGAVCAHPEIVKDAAVAATCWTTGLTEGSHCADCGMVLTAQAVVPLDPNNHTGITELKGIAATCTATGWTDGTTCGDCHAVIKAQEEIALLPHTAVSDAGVAATCTTAGLTEGSHCSVCQTVLKAQEEIPALNHKAVVEDEAIAATCKKDGKTAGSHCGICGKVLTEQTTVKAKGHNWKWNSQKQPSCTGTGEQVYKCTNCSAVKRELLPATGHSFERVNNGGKLESDENGNPVMIYDYVCNGCGMEKQQRESMNAASLAGNEETQFTLISGTEQVSENSKNYHLYEITDETGTHYYLENSGSGEGLNSFSFESSNGNLQSIEYGSDDPSDSKITLQSGGEGASELGFHTESSNENGMSFSFSQDNEKQEVESIEAEEEQVVIKMKNGASLTIPTKGMKASIGEIEEGAKIIDATIVEHHEGETEGSEKTSDDQTEYPSETAVEPETEAAAEAETEAETEMETETEAAAETESVTETETESETEAETESESETETERPYYYVEIVFATKTLYEETEPETIQQIQETEVRRIERFVDQTETPTTIVKFVDQEEAQNYIEVIEGTEETQTSKKETPETCAYDADSWPQPLCKCVRCDSKTHKCPDHGTVIEHVKEFRAESFYKFKRYCPVCDTWNG